MSHVTHVVCYGDSITQGPAGTNIADSGPGNWVEQWSNRLADTSNNAQQIISPGFRGLWLSGALAFNSDASGTSADEWTVDAVAHWASVAQGAAYNKSPHGQLWAGANGASAVATWHRKNGVAPVVGFDLLYIDYPSSGDWQYRVDGGAWTNMGQSNNQQGQLKKFYVATAVSSTVDIRQFNGTTSAGAAPVGIIPYYADPRTASGLVFHNLGRFGFWLEVTSNILHANTGADPLAFFDSCVLGTNAVAHTPVLTTLEFVNDLPVIHDATKWATDLDHYWTRYSPMNVPLILFQMYELTSIDATLQSTYRTNSATFASGKNVTLINLFSAYQNLGYGGVGTQAAKLVGTISSDGTHPNQSGCYDIGQRLLELTRSTFFPTVYQPSWRYTTPAFTTGATQLGTTVLAGEVVPIYSLADAVGITDTLSRALIKTRSLSDTVGITDTVRPRVTLRFALANTVAVTDTVATTSTHARTLPNTVGITDVVAQAFVQPRDTVAITATATAVATHPRTFAETVGLTDVAAAHTTKIRSSSDTVGIAATVADRLGVARAVNGTVGISATISEGATRPRTLPETVGIADVATANIGKIRSAADTVGISATIRLMAVQTAADTVGITDFLAVHAPKVRFLTDTVGIAGTTGHVAEHRFVNVSDTVGVGAVMTIRLITTATSQKIYTPTIATVEASQNSAVVAPSANLATVI